MTDIAKTPDYHFDPEFQMPSASQAPDEPATPPAIKGTTVDEAGENLKEHLHDLAANNPGPTGYEAAQVLHETQTESLPPIFRSAGETSGYFAKLNGLTSRKQVGGDHYVKHDIQPFDIIDAYGLDFFEGNALKYLLRHRDKNGQQDLEKAIHYLECVLQRQYGVKPRGEE